jgi:hypothetical protein
MGPTVLGPFRRKACWEFFRPWKIRLLQPGLNPANFGSKGHHATSRPPKPLDACLTGRINILTLRKQCSFAHRGAFDTQVLCLILYVFISRQVSLGQVFFRALQSSPVILPTLYNHLNIKTALIRWTRGWNFESFKQYSATWDIGQHWTEKNFYVRLGKKPPLYTRVRVSFGITDRSLLIKVLRLQIDNYVLYPDSSSILRTNTTLLLYTAINSDYMKVTYFD